MIGIDITRISRFKNKDESFVKRILSVKELTEYYNQIENKDFFLATRWAIKEAIFKADNTYLNFSKITIFKNNEKYFLKGFEISTSSEDDYVIAFVQRKRG